MPNCESDATELNTKWFYKTKKTAVIIQNSDN